MFQKFREISYKVPMGFKTLGTNVDTISFFLFSLRGCLSLLGGCVQTESFQPQINPTAKGLAFPTELISPVQPSVAPGVINARIYL